MIRSHFGLQCNPFDPEALTLLAHQQEIFDILRIHAQQGGLCLVLGEPGTGKSVLKQTLLTHDPKRMITSVVNRTLHTYHNTLRILCEAFQIEFEGAAVGSSDLLGHINVPTSNKVRPIKTLINQNAPLGQFAPPSAS
jgi:type II secretory pathway predicted ATPase ExeA